MCISAVKRCKLFKNSNSYNLKIFLIFFHVQVKNDLCRIPFSAIVAGAEPDGLSIAQIMKNIPEDWNEQRNSLVFPER